MRTELINRMTQAHARMFTRPELERALNGWRRQPKVESSWGCTDAELETAVEQAVEVAPDTIKQLFGRVK